MDVKFVFQRARPEIQQLHIRQLDKPSAHVGLRGPTEAHIISGENGGQTGWRDSQLRKVIPYSNPVMPKISWGRLSFSRTRRRRRTASPNPTPTVYPLSLLLIFLLQALTDILVLAVESI